MYSVRPLSKGSKVRLMFLSLIVTMQRCNTKELPSFIHVCQRDDPNLVECLIASAEDLRPYLAKGVPECNIPSIEPLVMNELISEQSVGLSLTANNVKTYGCSSYTVTSLKVNMDEQTYEFDTEFPLLSIEAQYNVSGKLLMMPVNGAGPLYANLTNCKSKTMLKGELYDRDGETYLRYKDLSLHIQIGGGSIKIENLFRGDKFISDIVHESLNKNLNAFLVELMPAVERALASTFLEVGNKIVHPYTYKQLFPY